jgi:apolipoprotein N-acyltransferase
MTAVRAAESGRWIARAANTGVSALIDEEGRVRAQTQIFERGLLVEDIEIAALGRENTFYVRHGDLFATACWVASGGAALLALRGRRGGANA